MAAQFTLTKEREERRDRRWIARATSSLPVPVSPVISTVASVGATLNTRESTFCKAPELPTISSHIDPLSISSGRATLSCLSFSSDCFGSAMITATLAITCLTDLGTLHARQTPFFMYRIVEPVPSGDNPRWSHRRHHIGTEGMPFYRGGN